MRNLEREQEAQKAADFVRRRFGLKRGRQIDAGLILGTGWSDSIKICGSKTIALNKIPGFELLGNLEGHKRNLIYGFFAGKEVLVLQGRVHLNEAPCSEAIYKMVRLQVEMLFQLGVNTLLVTNAAGSLVKNISVGDLMVVDGFVTVFAPSMPLWGGEFYSPEDTLDLKLQRLAKNIGKYIKGIRVKSGGYAMVMGPFFEGRKYDKKIIRRTGASAVGMSTLPEACIAALYDVKVLGLSFITNSAVEKHSHEENQARAKAKSLKLGEFLFKVVSQL